MSENPGLFFTENFSDHRFGRDVVATEKRFGQELAKERPAVKEYADLRAKQLDLETELACVKRQMVPMQAGYDEANKNFLRGRGVVSVDEYVNRQFAAEIAYAILTSLDDSAKIMHGRDDFALVDAKTLASFMQTRGQLDNLKRAVRDSTVSILTDQMKLLENGEEKARAFMKLLNGLALSPGEIRSFAGIEKAQGVSAVYVLSPDPDGKLLGAELATKLREIGDKGLPNVLGLPGAQIGRPGMVKFNYSATRAPSGILVSGFTPRYIGGLQGGDNPSLNETDRDATARAVLNRLSQVGAKELGLEKFFNAALQYRACPIPEAFAHFAIERLKTVNREGILDPQYALNAEEPEIKTANAPWAFTPYNSLSTAAQEALERLNRYRAEHSGEKGITWGHLSDVLATREGVLGSYGIPSEKQGTRATSRRIASFDAVEKFIRTHTYTATRGGEKQQTLRWVPQ